MNEEKIIKIYARTITRTSVSCAIALICTQAVADDTELLLAQPDPSTSPTPNVMFILDTSGSMGGDVTTVVPYDSTAIYAAGPCSTDAIYWTDIDLLPVCGTSNTQWVPKTSFHCDYASKQIAGIGSYTNTMAQFRNDASGTSGVDADRWQYLEPGDNTGAVECQADAGRHGENSLNPTRMWADSASDPSGAWTDNPDAAVSWGGAPRNLAYTVYDGNYLNWKSTPVATTM